MAQTSLHFVTPDAGGEVRFVLDNGWTGTAQHAHPVTVQDLRGQPTPVLDTDGFTLTVMDNRHIDFDDMAHIERHWFPMVRETVLSLTGGTWATLFAGPLVRFSNRHVRSTASSVSAPARAVHADLPADFGFMDVARQPVAERAAAEMHAAFGNTPPARWRIVNVWQMISPPPQDNTLAMCRLSSVKPADVLAGKGYFDEPGTGPANILARRTDRHDFDITFFGHAPAQEWCYFSDMTPGETLVFSTYNPAQPRLRGRTPHAAVDLADTAGAANPRQSIEIRALVAF